MAWVALIPLLPALAFFVLWPMSRRVRNSSIWIALVAAVGSLVLAVIAFAAVWGAPHGEGAEPVYRASAQLGELGGVPFKVGIHLDPVTAVMLLVVTIVGTCVAVYSVGYMREEERKGWYFAALSLFNAAMLGLVLADNFLLLYMTWEVMGLCSYLLIGFWHDREEARFASIKAFLTTRVGDVAFALGLAVMWTKMHSFDFAAVLGEGAHWETGAATAVAMLFLLGAMGKSAQVPLHVWLPDAMAGPTPASATIHAATMVAAGVYLVSRALPIFHEAAPWVLMVVLVVGLTTLLVAGLLALVQHDIKKILAYSTISQLGYMFVALGAGSEIATLFHLTTHAFFKSLLFLGAGVIIHATHTQDIREMGGLRKKMTWTTVAFTTGALALAGFPPFSGFWSKDEILGLLWEKQLYLPFALGLLGALVTAFYVARMWFRVFSVNRGDGGHAHEGEPVMVGPTLVYAVITACIGFAGPTIATFLGEPKGWPEISIPMVSSVGVVAVGLASGWYVFGRAHAVDTEAIKTRLGWVYTALAEKLYFDKVYSRLLIRPYMALADSLARFDGRVIDGIVNGVASAWKATSAGGWTFDIKIIDGTVNGLAAFVKETGARARRIQVGRVQSYQRFMFAGIVVFFVLTFAILMKGA